MSDVRMYYAETPEDVFGRQFRGQDLTFVYLNDEKFTDKEREAAKAYIARQDPQVATGVCNGKPGFEDFVEGRRSTYEHNRVRTGNVLVPVVVPSLPPRARGVSSWLHEIRERVVLGRVNTLEQQWPAGSVRNLEVLVGYLKNSSSRVRETAAIAIGEYLPVVDSRQGRGQASGKAAAALLDALSSEDSGPVLVNLGSALGNTPSLVKPEALAAALRGRSGLHVAKVAEGIRLLRETEDRRRLLETLEDLPSSEPA